MENEHPFIVIHDPRRLRGAALVSLLQDWPRTSELELHVFRGTLEDRTYDPAKCRMCIVDLGSDPLDSIETRLAISLMHALYPAAPVVVISEMPRWRELVDLPDVVQGFISTDTEPSVMFAALDLVLSGGRYMSPPGATERPRDAGVRRSPDNGAASTGNAGSDADWDKTEDTEQDDTDMAGSMAYTQRRATSSSAAVSPSISGLTKRQTDVLMGLHEGKSNKEIARDLNISDATVKVYIRQLLRKLGAANRTQLAIATLPSGSGGFDDEGDRGVRVPLPDPWSCLPSHAAA